MAISVVLFVVGSMSKQHHFFMLSVSGVTGQYQLC